MSKQITLSICIPTFNRAYDLKNLLGKLIPQAVPLKDFVEICISNNASVDNTRNVVMNLVQKYPDLIRYNENSENLGFDRNLLKAVGMARGLLVWFFGDDDLIADNGLNEVVAFARKIDLNKVGLVVLRRESYFVEKDSRRRIVYSSTFDAKMPSYFKIGRKDVLAGTFPDDSFMSVLVINNALLEKVLSEDSNIVEEGCKTYYVHTLLYRLMFWKYPHIAGYVLNKTIVFEEMPHYRFTVEDEFELLLQGRSRVEDILMSTKYATPHKALLIKRKRSFLTNFVGRLAFMKAFGTFNYGNYGDCLRSFLNKLPLPQGILLSGYFIVISMTPAPILRNTVMGLLKRIREDEWERHWIHISSIFSLMGRKGRRRIQEP